MRSKKPILLVEDDEVDAMTVRRALKEINVTNKLHVAGNGEDALEYLKDAGNERPCLVLLDLNMPRMNGIEFLKESRKDASLGAIPTVVLTTSRDEKDKVESFKLNAAGYIAKPVDYQQFVEAMRTVNMYWTLSEVPE